MKLYKYASATDLGKILLHDSFSIKFDRPANYNDPLELFLSPKGENDPYVFAAFHHLLSELPQLPTTCFSKRPDVLPMWAHYGGNHTGFVLELDEHRLADYFEAGFFEDVEYKSEIGFCDLGIIRYAATTCKPRHVHRARSLAFRSAYFTKSDCWAYEQERRLVLDGSHFDENEKMMIREFPAQCITSILSGCRTGQDDVERLREAASRFGCPILHLRLGKSLSQPYFVGRKTAPEVFNGHEITAAEFSCGSCGDPIEEDRESCPWCEMTEEDAYEAALNDPMNMFAIAGLPNPYGLSFAGIRAVGTRTK